MSLPYNIEQEFKVYIDNITNCEDLIKVSMSIFILLPLKHVHMYKHFVLYYVG